VADTGHVGLGERVRFIGIHSARAYSDFVVRAVELIAIETWVGGVPCLGDLLVHGNLFTLDTRNPLVKVCAMEVGVDSTAIVVISMVCLKFNVIGAHVAIVPGLNHLCHFFCR